MSFQPKEKYISPAVDLLELHARGSILSASDFNNANQDNNTEYLDPDDIIDLL